MALRAETVPDGGDLIDFESNNSPISDIGHCQCGAPKCLIDYDSK